jgi:hypothetical protein
MPRPQSSTIVDNHMAHIQQAAEDASASLSAMTESNKQMVTTMKEMRMELKCYQCGELFRSRLALPNSDSIFMFQDTVAVELLLSGVPIDQV